MAHPVPPELSAVLDAPEGALRNDAWAAFVERHSRLLLHVARSFGGDHDAVMDRYAYILERLQDDGCRRLRSWAGDRRSSLSTWLVIVARRMSLDQNRQRYGRPRGDEPVVVEARRTRRRLADLLAEQVDHLGPASAIEDGDQAPDLALRRAELSEALARSVAELEAGDQLLLTLRFHDGLPAAAIARSLGIPTPFHVYRRINRVLEVLRRSLGDRGVEDPLP